MIPKSILVPVDGGPRGDAALDAAFMVARKFDSHVEALHVRTDPQSVIPLMTDPMGSPVMGDLIADVERNAGQMAAAARSQFDAAIARAQIPIADKPGVHAGASAQWHELSGSEAVVVGERGRVFDLIVARRQGDASEHLARATFEAALLDAGRPVLVVPPDPSESLGRVVTIAWNRSGPCGRSVASNMGFLREAERVAVVSVLTGAKSGPSAHDLAEQLAWHGVNADVKEIPPDYRTVAEIVHAEAVAFGSDLLVMGAFSHSRLREMIFGGVTQEVFASTTVPVVMVR